MTSQQVSDEKDISYLISRMIFSLLSVSYLMRAELPDHVRESANIALSAISYRVNLCTFHAVLAISEMNQIC
jgi:hypothetical protein